jgi:hypothetical protein
MMNSMSRLIGSTLRGLGFLALFPLGVSSAQAACNGYWDLSGSWRWIHSNGYAVDFDLQQASGAITGTGKFSVEADPRVVSGGLGPLEEVFPTHQFPWGDVGQIVAGSVTGNVFSFSINWRSGALGEYAGSVDDNGFVTGMTYDRASPGNTANWGGDRPATCVAVKAVDPVNPKKLVPRADVTINTAPAKTLGDPIGPTGLPPEALPGIPMATVTGDVDVYDVPGGVGTVIGMLVQGAQVSAECREDRWCAVSGDVPPHGNGWVWGEFLAF